MSIIHTPDKFLLVENTMSAATVTWEDLDSSATSSVGTFFFDDDDFLLSVDVALNFVSMIVYSQRILHTQSCLDRAHPSHSRSIASSPADLRTQAHLSMRP